MQGADEETAIAIEEGKIEQAKLNEKEQRLLEFVKLVTETAYRTTSADVEKLRKAGWSDDQISEAIYVTSMFAMFNRVADAFGLEDPNYRGMSDPAVNRPAEKFE